MDELSPRARALLQEARPAFSPQPPELARLRARLDLPGPSGDDGGPSGDGGAAAVASSGAANFGLYLVLAAMVVLVAWSVAGPRRPGAVSPAMHRMPLVVAGVSMPPPKPVVASPPMPAVRVESVVRAPPAAGEPVVGPTPRPRRTRPDAGPRVDAPLAAIPEPQSDALAAELALIGDARRAANGGAWATVRSLVATHARSFPDGVLREEARVLDLLARCATEPSPELTASVREYLGTPGRLFASRLRRACNAEDELTP